MHDQYTDTPYRLVNKTYQNVDFCHFKTQQMWQLWGIVAKAGICYVRLTCLHFFDGKLNRQRYRDEIMRPILMPFVKLHHLTFQRDNACLHIARICRDLLGKGMGFCPHWPPYSPDMSQLWHVPRIHFDLGCLSHLVSGPLCFPYFHWNHLITKSLSNLHVCLTFLMTC